MLALEGHSGQVTAAAFSPCGRWFVSAGWDGTLRLWERPGYDVRRVLRGAYDHVVHVAFSADSKHLAVAFRNREGWQEPLIFGNLAFTPVLAPPRTDSTKIPYYDTWFALDGARRVAVRRIVPHPIHAHHVVVTGDDNVVRVWDAKARVVARSYTDKAIDLTGAEVCFAPDGILALRTGGLRDGKVLLLWDDVVRKSWRRPEVIPLGDEVPCSFVFSPDGASLFIGAQSGRIAQWLVGKSRRPRWSAAMPAPPVGLAATPDGRSLLVAGEDGLIRRWDAKGRRVRDTFDWRIGTIASVAVAPDGLTAAAAGDGVVMIWDLDG